MEPSYVAMCNLCSTTDTLVILQSLWLAEESGALLENLSLNERGGSIRSVAMVSGETRRIPYSSDAFVSIKRNLLVSTSKLGSMSVYDLDNLPLESRS